MEKQQVINLLAQTNVSEKTLFNQLLEQYKNHPSKDDFLFKRLNRLGYSKDNYEKLVYEIKKIYQIKDLEIVSFQTKEHAQALESIQSGEEELKTSEEEETFDRVISLKEEEKNEKLKLREEFPFLSDKNCPDVMHIAVARKITAYETEQAINAEIHAISEQNPNDERLKELAEKALEAHQENEALYNELVHYRDNETVLGKHPIFDELFAKQEVEKMSNDELLKFINSSKTFLSRAKNNLEKAAEDKKEEIEKSIRLREYKLTLVKNKLGV